MKKSLILTLLFISSILLFAQAKYNYSQQPLSVLGFNKTSTRVEVEKSLRISGLEYEQFFSDDENWIAETMLNSFGGGATMVYEVEWNNMLFDKIYFLYDSKQKLAKIEMYPTFDAKFVEVKKLFNEVTADCPKRRTASFSYGTNDEDKVEVSILIKNGANENESAVLTITEPYLYEFYFNGGQLKDYSELGEW